MTDLVSLRWLAYNKATPEQNSDTDPPNLAKTKTMLKPLLFVLSLTCTSCVLAQQTTPSQQITRSERFADAAALFKASQVNTLYVFDIDDTLLTSDTFFGSDHWYEWQKSLSKADLNYVPCKFDVIAINFELGAMHATEPEALALVNSIKHDKLFLTARNPGYRSATERELKRASYQLPGMLHDNPDGLSFRLNDSEQNRSAEVSYQNGIYMVNGLGKGEALMELLSRLKLQYDKVVLVDDGRKNIDSMAAATSKRGIAYHGFHYLQIGKAVPPQLELQQAAHRSWTKLRHYLRDYAPARLQQLEAGQCAY